MNPRTDSARGLLVDMDGTLADSLSVMRLVYGRFLESFGIQGTDDGFERVNGVPLRIVVERLKQTHELEPDERALLRQFVTEIDRGYDDVPRS